MPSCLPLQEVPQQHAGYHADGADQRSRDDQSHLSSMRALALLLGTRLFHEVGVAVSRDDDDRPLALVGVRRQHAVLDELGLQLVFGSVGERAAIHQLSVDAAGAALEIDKAL